MEKGSVPEVIKAVNLEMERIFWATQADSTSSPESLRAVFPSCGQREVGHPGRFIFVTRVLQSRECFPAVVIGSCNYGRSSIREMLHCLL